MNKRVLIPLALTLLLAGACAKNDASTTGQDAQEYLKLWMEDHHPGVTPNEDGLYILQDLPGTGDTWDSEKPYILADLTIRALSGTISSTTHENLAKQLGTYVKGYYYGPKYQMTGSDVSYAGLDALLKGMRVGGTRKAVIPAWMLTTNRFSTQQEYINACSVSTSLIYELSLIGQSENPEKDAIAMLKTYVKEHYGAEVTPVSYVTGEEADGSFWFISDASGFDGKDPLPSSATIKIHYTGSLLNGTVFDTTLEKVAKDNGIYKAGNKYQSASINYNTNYQNITMGSSSSLISGFKGGLSLMRWKGQKATVLFTSQHGYSTSGSGSTIPSYAPLIFELEILDE